MSVEEAAERLGGISKWTIHAWLSKGKLRRTKVGSRTMISQRDLDEFLANCNPKSSAQIEGTSTPQQVKRDQNESQ